MRELDSDWKILGLTPSSYTPGIITTLCTNIFLLKFWVELLTFAYLAQCRCDPAGTVDYLAALEHIVQAMQVMNEDTLADLQTLVLEERMRFMRDDFLKAVGGLDFGPNCPLGVDFDESVEAEFIINAWRDGVRRSWDNEMNSLVTRREPNNALRVTADVSGDKETRRVWGCKRGSIMTVGTVYSTPGVSRDVDESTIITAPDIQVSETLS
jgi:ubiquitin carboxyl-terminal hydrolase 25/28